MKVGAPGSFGAQLKSLREAAGYTQEELATIAGLSVHAVSALERGERRQPHVETVRALSAALDELSGVSLPLPLTALLGRDGDMQTLRHWLADSAARLITLIGPGGVGKTRLALELARAIADEGATRVVFASLAATRDPGFVASAIAEALGLADVTALDLPRRARVACQDYPHTARARQFRASRVGRSTTDSSVPTCWTRPARRRRSSTCPYGSTASCIARRDSVRPISMRCVLGVGTKRHA